MKIFKRILLLLPILVAAAVFYNYPKLNMISGYAAKNMASTVFLTTRNANSVAENDHKAPLIELAESEVDENKKSAFATVFGMMERQAIYREGLGAVLVNDDYDPNAFKLVPRRTIAIDTLPFPYGNQGKKDSIFANIDYDKLEAAIDMAFANPDIQKTRTALVVYKNQIVGERYVEGFDKNTPILGWSMTKSILATLYGILEHQGKIDVGSPAPIASWQDDKRQQITLNHLLRMQSGLAWDEDYTSISDVTQMLFLDSDMTQAQMNQDAVASPTEIWNYSSGTSNLLSGILRKQFETHQEYLNFPYAVLIDKIGMHSMLIEADMVGNYVGSSYAWANTRDWAKFGLLYLHRGNWKGEQLFAPEWVDYISKPTEHSDGKYGAHFWLNAKGKYPDVP
ncbi:MAG: serine hydrolase domain-containing protein, partial [Aurantibacter sp.]